MIAAPLMVVRDSTESLWGTFEFAQLPAPGDRINIEGANGRVQRLTVSYIHTNLYERVSRPEPITAPLGFMRNMWTSSGDG